MQVNYNKEMHKCLSLSKFSLKAVTASKEQMQSLTLSVLIIKYIANDNHSPFRGSGMPKSLQTFYHCDQLTNERCQYTNNPCSKLLFIFAACHVLLVKKLFETKRFIDCWGETHHQCYGIESFLRNCHLIPYVI